MAQEDTVPDEGAAKASKFPLILGLALAIAGAGAGFYAAWSGMILGSGEAEHHAGTTPEDEVAPLGDIAFVPVDPMVISVDSRPTARLLRFRAQLEVPSNHAEDVTVLLPRVIDVLNSYLRALDVSDLEDQAALTRLRSQMLRRIQVVTGPGRVNDLLIMEFVLT